MKIARAKPCSLPGRRVMMSLGFLTFGPGARTACAVTWLYACALFKEFRWTFLALAVALALGAGLIRISDHHQRFLVSLYYAWMFLLGQTLNPPETWYIALVSAIYPLLGFLLFGEGIIRLTLLLLSRRRREKEWMRVMASTYRDHVILCGLGHLGYRVIQQLIASDVPVVVLEHNATSRFVANTKELNVPVLIRDMKEDQALIDAGVQHARAIIIATNDDVANIEVALDSRRLSPKIRVLMRLFDQQIAAKIAKAFLVDVAFSSSTLAAPMVAAMSLESSVLTSYVRDGVQQVIAEIRVDPTSALVGMTAADAEHRYGAKVLLHQESASMDRAPGSTVSAGDVLRVHLPAARLPALAASGRPVAAA